MVVNGVIFEEREKEKTTVLFKSREEETMFEMRGERRKEMDAVSQKKMSSSNKIAPICVQME